MFKGSKEISLDEKGRLTMPAAFKRVLEAKSGGMMTLTRDPQFNCIRCYPNPEWERVAEEINSLPSFSKTARALRAIIVQGASPVDMDKQGRALVPQEMRNLLGLEGKVTLCGSGEHFEMWEPQAYAEYIADASEHLISGVLNEDEFKHVRL